MTPTDTPIEARAKARTLAWIKAGMPPREPSAADEQEFMLMALLKAARHDPVLWERCYAMSVDYRLVKWEVYCIECHDGLNVAGGWSTRDLLFIRPNGGAYEWAAEPPKRVLAMKLGGVNLCEACCFDPEKAAARAKRRARVKHSGNYIAGAGE